jgi:hypothetical protein
MGYADPEHLPGQDMVYSLLEVGNLSRQSFGEEAGDLPQEHTRLCEWIKKPN